MKYIILKDTIGMEIPIIFPERITHKAMAQHVQHLLMRETQDSTEVVSAGFCSVLATCSGSSESLRISSRPDDSIALSFNESISGVPVADVSEDVVRALRELVRRRG